jgi:hypothetical protein
MAFGYARVKPDAFSDITDVRVRNDRIMQDIANQKRNWEVKQAAAEFDAWQKQNARKDYGYYDKGLAIQNGFKTQPFAGKAPSISQGLSRLGITPDGKLTFGSHGSNMVMPFRRKPVFKTDENGNPTPLSADEEAILQQESDKTSQQAAAEAASGAPVQNGGDGSSSIENPSNSQASPWYDFLKHPQNTPYELEQMRNQGILRDAAIAAAMNKPVFFPEADTLSEPMAKLAGQQNGLAQSAMQQLTARQGMTSDLFKQGMSMVNNYAMQSFNAQIEANKAYNAAKSAYKDAKILRDKTEALYGKNGYEYLEAVRNKDLEKQQEIAFRYNDGMKQAEMRENDSERMLENANNFIGKANAFRGSANQISKDLEFGFNFGDEIGMYQPFENENTELVSQSDMKDRNVDSEIGNGAGSYNFVGGKGGSKAHKPKNDVPEAPVYDAEGNLMFTPMFATEDSEKNKVFVEPDGSVYDSDKDPIRSSWNKLLGNDVAIANRRAWGSREHFDKIAQANADNTQWLKNVQDVFGKILAEVRKNPANQAKYADILAPILAQADRFGLSEQVKNEELNIPRSNSLNAYENEILASGNPVLVGLWDSAKSGSISETWLKDLENQLSTQFETKNASGRNDVLLRNNGLKLNYTLDKKNKTKGGKPKYFVKFVDSFK